MKQIAIIATLCLLANAVAAKETSVTIPLTTAHERVVVALWEGDIKVTSGAAGTVIIVSDCELHESEAPEQMEGFRSLRSSSVLPDIVPGDEVIAIRTYEGGPRCSVTLEVPERLDLHTRVNFSGSIDVDARHGRLLAWSATGDVSVANHSGSLSVTAMNGDATVSIGDEGIDADSAITAANGTLTITVNPDSIPAMRAQARWGEVQTNLDATFEEVVQAGGTWFALEGGAAAPILTMRNLNRDIVIRSSSP
jgi:hypothetical protein